MRTEEGTGGHDLQPDTYCQQKLEAAEDYNPTPFTLDFRGLVVNGIRDWTVEATSRREHCSQEAGPALLG